MPDTHITQTSAALLPVPERGQTIYRDDATRGFGVRVTANGVRTYIVEYQRRGLTKRHTIGRIDDFRAAEARNHALEIRASAARGVYPEDRRFAEVKTVSDLLDCYLESGPDDKPNKGAASWATDKYNFKRHIRPTLGSTLLADLDAQAINRAVTRIRNHETQLDERGKGKRSRSIVKGGAGAAARAMSAFRAALNWGISKGMLGQIDFKQALASATAPNANYRPVFLTTEELKKLLTTVRQLGDEKTISWQSAAIFELLIYTGSRKQEIAALRWSEVSEDGRVLHLSPDRVKHGERERYLSNPAVQLLQSLKAKSGEGDYVFPSRGDEGSYSGLKRHWPKITKALGKSGLTIHGIRHSVVSHLIQQGISNSEVAKIVGHKNITTTRAYIHFDNNRIADTVNRSAIALAPAAT